SYMVWTENTSKVTKMKRKLGIQGEEMAAMYLTKNGYQIITRNYYTRYGELDIICEKNNTIIFVEVKTRTSTRYGLPQEAVTNMKIAHLKKAAMIYLNSLNKRYREIRFDVIAILITGEKNEISHIIGAF
ncbi:MAG: YraN family protein, partial [Syntrophomonas sp.]